MSMRRNKKNRVYQFIKDNTCQSYDLHVKFQGEDVINMAYLESVYKVSKNDVIRQLIRSEYERLKRKELFDQIEQRIYRDGTEE